MVKDGGILEIAINCNQLWRETAMSFIRYVGISLVAIVFLGGCESTPTVTRSGDVKDIIVGDNLSPGEIVVSPGDEVRWVNKRTGPVRIVFLSPVSNKDLSCKNNFGGLMTPSNTAKLATNETASACFRDPGHFRYTVRMETADLTGERNVSGVIKVGGQSTGQASDPNSTARSREEAGDQTEGQPSEQKKGTPGSTSTTTTTTITTTPGK
jgi:plastocyanin